jgi:Na+/melibiose symporter and related transporters
MTTPVPTSASADATDLPDKGERKSLRALGLRGLFVSLPFVLFSMSVVWGGTGGILAGLQLQRLDPADKVANLAWMIGISTLFTMVAAPAVGAFSDRTRTRLGGRLPWMIIGAITAVTFAALMSFASSIVLVIVFYVGIQVSTMLINTPVSAFIPDKVPAAKRGAFSAAVGLSALVGATFGQVIGAVFSNVIVVGYLVVTGLLALSVLVFVLVNKRGEDNRAVSRVSFRLIDLLSTFWVSPVKHPEFAWAFAGRFLLYTGYFTIGGYQLYILQDYIGLSEQAAISLVPLIGAIGLIGLVPAIPLAGALSDRFGRVKIFVLIASITLAVGVLVPVFLPTVTGMIIYSVVAGLGFGAYTAVDYALITRVLPSEQDFGKDIGIINITTSLPQTIAAAVAGIVVTLFGGFQPLFIVAAVCAIVGAISLRFIKSVR